jgi:hypothetical protein
LLSSKKIDLKRDLATGVPEIQPRGQPQEETNKEQRLEFQRTVAQQTQVHQRLS